MPNIIARGKGVHLTLSPAIRLARAESRDCADLLALYSEAASLLRAATNPLAAITNPLPESLAFRVAVTLDAIAAQEEICYISLHSKPLDKTSPRG